MATVPQNKRFYTGRRKYLPGMEAPPHVFFEPVSEIEPEPVPVEIKRGPGRPKKELFTEDHGEPETTD